MSRFASLLALLAWLPTTVAAQDAPPAEPARPAAPVDSARPEAAPPVSGVDVREEPGFDLSRLHTPGGLTADAAAARAVETARSIERARAAIELSEAGARRAWLGVLPQVDLSARYTRLSRVSNPSFGGGGLTPEQEAAARDLIAGVADPNAQLLFTGTLEAQLALVDGFTFPQILDQFGLRASVTYPVSDVFLTILPTYRALLDATEASRVQVEVERETVAFSAREAYYGLVRARGAQVVAQASVAQAQAQRRQVAALVEAGAAARVDLMRVDAALASAQVAVTRTGAGVAISEAALRQLLHLPGTDAVEVGDDMRRAPPALPGTRDELVDRAVSARAEVRALQTALSAQRAQVDVQRNRRYPHFAVAANLDVANPNNRIVPQEREFRATWDLSAVVSWSPNELLDASRRADEARATMAQTEADLRALEDGIRVDVIRAFEQRAAAAGAIEAAAAGLAAAEEQYRVRFEQLQAGAAVTSDLIDANTDVTRARLQLLDAHIDLHVAAARLRRAVGIAP